MPKTRKRGHPDTVVVVERAVDTLVPYPRNPRRNDGIPVERMVASISEFGFKIPILARSDGTVIDGHLRLKAALKLGIERVPVILCDEWSDAQVKAFRLMVNRSVAWAEWDEDLLKLEIEDLKTLDFDLQLTGFDADELTKITLGDVLTFDDAPESVSRNADEIEEIKAAQKETRKNENAAVLAKSDTEKYLVIVFANRAAKEAQLALMGLPTDERYLAASTVDLRVRGKTVIHSNRSAKSPSIKKAGGH